jgi:hypothetical protein
MILLPSPKSTVKFLHWPVPATVIVSVAQVLMVGRLRVRPVIVPSACAGNVCTAAPTTTRKARACLHILAPRGDDVFCHLAQQIYHKNTVLTI